MKKLLYFVSFTQNMNKIEVKPGIYFGDRKDKFCTHIRSILKSSGVEQELIDVLTSDKNIKFYGDAFTEDTVDEDNNYQIYEQIGDKTGNKIIVSYMYQRFPQLQCVDGVAIVARLVINYGSKQSFFTIAERMGFWDFITATNYSRQCRKKPLLEDVFEAFLGVTEVLVEKERPGDGFEVVRKIVTKAFDQISISLKYEDLFDPVTRLKELFDYYNEELGKLEYKDEKKEMITYTTAYCLRDSERIELGVGSACLKNDSRQFAAREALKNLAEQGWTKPVPEIYERFVAGKGPKRNVKMTEKMVSELFPDINAQYMTKTKNKHQVKYTSTPLGMYCRKRNLSGIRACLSLGANIREVDSEEMTCTDLLMIGASGDKRVEDAITSLIKHGKKRLIVHRSVFDTYKENLGKYSTRDLFIFLD